MISLKTIIAPAILLLALTGCHENFRGPLYEHKVSCPGVEPVIFTETVEQTIYASVWSSGYIKVTVKQRHGKMLLEEHEWTEQEGNGCSFHKRFIRMVKPTESDE